MSGTLTRPRPAAPAPPPAQFRPDRAPSSVRRSAVVGVLFVLLLVAALVVSLATFNGAFSAYDVVTVSLPASANAVAVGNPVDYRDVQVGTVADVNASSTGGAVRVVLHMDPADLSDVPADVHAAAVPLSVFGTQYIDLQVPTGTPVSPARLVSGSFIPATATSGSSSLQTTVANIDDILTALHPADLADAFDALATALNGQGRALGTTLAASAAYLGQLLPQLPTLESDLGLLAPVGDQLSFIVPPLLASVGQFSATARTITADQQDLGGLLAGGPPLAGAANTLLDDIAVPFQTVAADITPLLDDLGQNPQELSQVLAGFSSAAQGFATATQGSSLRFSGSLDIDDQQALVNAGLASGPLAAQDFEEAVGPQNFNPTSYTSAQCPRYGPWVGPNCASGADARPADAAAAGTAVADTPAVDAGVVQMARGLDGGHTPPSAAAATLLLAPLVAALGGGS